MGASPFPKVPEPATYAESLVCNSIYITGTWARRLSLRGRVALPQELEGRSS